LIPMEPLLVGTKRIRVVLATAFYQTSRMFDMKYFMEEDEFNKPFRDFRRIQRLANRNRLMDRVVMAQDVARAPLRPGQDGLFHVPVEVAAIKTGKEFLKVIKLPACRRDDFVAPMPAGDF